MLNCVYNVKNVIVIVLLKVKMFAKENRNLIYEIFLKSSPAGYKTRVYKLIKQTQLKRKRI